MASCAGASPCQEHVRACMPWRSTGAPGQSRACSGPVPSTRGAVSELLQVRPELRVDGRRPTTAELVERLAALWLGNETVVYIGLAGTSLRDRINDYYRTPLGARSRHSGGWPLKTLGVLSLLWVHYAPCPDPVAAEHQMLNVFAAHVSPETRTKLKDPAMPVPFANLEHAKGHRKRHGITGTRAPRKPSPVTPERVDKLPLTSGPETSVRTQTPESVTPRKHTTPTTVHPGPMRSQRITDKDIQAGQVRFPASAKPVFPPERAGSRRLVARRAAGRAVESALRLG